MAKKQTTKRRASGTVASLAKALGFTPRHISTLLAKGLPSTIPEAREWLSERENSDTAAGLRRERIGLVRAQRQAAETTNQRIEGELISRAEVRAQYIKLGSALQSFCRRLETELPQQLHGLPLSKSLPLAKEIVRKMQARLADEDDELWADQPTEGVSLGS
jgi:phage terminase Nu1 subunit (DNA packaging protein)